LGKEGYQKYGKKLAKQLGDNLKVPARVYTEDDLTIPNVEVKSLHDVPGWKSFYEDTAHIEPQTYLFDARRFSHKVYAQLDAFESKHRYVVWLDGDVVIKKPFGQKFIKNLLDGEMCAYLGRQQSYTETGFIAFDTHHPDFPEFKKRYRDWYDKRHIFMLPYWIDCMAFDASIFGLSGKNLTPEGRGMMDVFIASPLADYMDHDKGLRKHQRPNEPMMAVNREEAV
jgi:hypothetical protein